MADSDRNAVGGRRWALAYCVRGYRDLVTDGPFSFTRNPLYLAGTMFVLGIGLVSGVVWF